jgi:hypothetical protein
MMNIAYITQDLMCDYVEDRFRRQEEIRNADREFEKVRRRALLRRLRQHLGLERELTVAERPHSARFSIALVDIAGIIHEDGRHEEGIPVLPRLLARSWRSAFVDPNYDSADESPFTFRIIGGAWYLEGGCPSLLRLELKALRGESRVRGRLGSIPQAACMMEEQMECLGEAEACRLAC